MTLQWSRAKPVLLGIGILLALVLRTDAQPVPANDFAASKARAWCGASPDCRCGQGSGVGSRGRFDQIPSIAEQVTKDSDRAIGFVARILFEGDAIGP